MARLLGSLTCDCWRPTLDERRNVNPREPCRVGIHKTPPQDSEHTQPCVWRGSPGPAAENPASRPRCHSKLAPFRSKATPALRHRPCLLCPPQPVLQVSTGVLCSRSLFFSLRLVALGGGCGAVRRGRWSPAAWAHQIRFRSLPRQSL